MSSIRIITGTWTPTLAFGGLSTGITYTTQVGLYSIIGGMIFVQFQIVLSSVGSATGNASISGLAPSLCSITQSIMLQSNVTLANAAYLCVGRCTTGSNPVISVLSQRVNGALQNPTSVTNTGFANTSFIYGCFKGITQ